MDIPELMETHHEAIAALRPPTQDLKPHEARRILARFGAAMEGNFVAWLASAAVFAQSEKGREAAKTNLIDENSGNHPDMLRAFLDSLDAIPVHHFDEVAESVSKIRKLIAPCSGLEELALMTLLESSSELIMPFIRSLAEVTRGTFDSTYCDVHERADGEHTRVFLEGLLAEAGLHTNAGTRIQKAEEVVRGFWKSILLNESEI